VVRKVTHYLSRRVNHSGYNQASPAGGSLPWSFLLATQITSQEVRFGEYMVDLRTGELRRNGAVLKLQPQPAKVLSILVGRPGEIVTRQELANLVWGSETYVDFEHGLNFAIRQIRSVLEDDPEHPRFLETIPKRGYRFIGPLINHVAQEPVQLPIARPVKLPRSQEDRVRTRLVYLALAAIVTATVVAVTWAYLRPRSPRTAAAARIESVAVLPLRNLSSDAEQEYFSDGMTDELITDLAKFASLRVISHTSVERYKGTKLPLPEIAKELGVDAVVEGTVMRSAEKVRITAQLIDARSDQHLWADTYERDLRDVFSLQDEVARQIAGQIGANLIAGQQLPANRRALDPVAHESYLRGNFYVNQLSCDGFSKSRQYFEQAVNRDPEFARAYVGLAESYFALTDWGCSSEPGLIAKSKAAAVKGLELDPSLGEAHAWLGKMAFFYEWDSHKAENELKRAIELSPNYPEAHIIYAVFLISTGRRELGLAEMTKAHDIDPISQLPNVIAVVAFYLAGQYDAAIEQGKKTIELYPDSVGAYDWLGYAYEKRGLSDQAIVTYLKAKELRGVSLSELSAFRTASQKDGVRGLWQKELENAERTSAPNPCWLTKIYAHLGNKDRALEFLKQSYQQHCSGPHTTIADPVFDGFHRDPRFKEVLAQLHL
jgi:TolB-like protein/DNA-binding winged helix-turn-helix (wHTH) protein/Flp pilus assembly protein TadD